MLFLVLMPFGVSHQCEMCKKWGFERVFSVDLELALGHEGRAAEQFHRNISNDAVKCELNLTAILIITCIFAYLRPGLDMLIVINNSKEKAAATTMKGLIVSFHGSCIIAVYGTFSL